MNKAKSVGFPLAGHFKLSSNQSPTSDKDKDEDKDEMLKISYVLAVGYLMYVVVCTRPDIAHSIGVNGKSMLDGFTDSDMADDVNSRKFTSRMNELHTTHSWKFLGINSINHYNHLPMDSKSNVVVTMIDSGVWPESKSFNDEGLGPVPKKFNEECIVRKNSHCPTVIGLDFSPVQIHYLDERMLSGPLGPYRKTIRARFYSKGYKAENEPLELANLPFFQSPRDADGHETHTASTVAGSIVINATLPGITLGTAHGAQQVLGLPSTRLVGSVIVLTPTFSLPLTTGILVSAFAWNSFFSSTAINVATWILTVAASFVDREFRAYLHLKNLTILKGFGLNPKKMESNYRLFEMLQQPQEFPPLMQATIIPYLISLDPSFL
ncbi:hypothetical protein HYC85_032005 [Camellia sinensis]|uniref:Peptidase S8/S53 domain-containing protein n=1 Tax=Camellia sinensis TaxID=4442 RepID=A0A7J7FS56_CAMSI|nr:hypothetical protein HYC85_032005 [Camellia sinensis]